MMLRFLCRLAWLAAVLSAQPARAQADAPFSTRNLMPPVAVFALPDWQPAPDVASFSAGIELANHYRPARRAGEVLLLDGETMRINLRFERPLAQGWSIAAELPFVRQSGGRLDDPIDGWHSLFDLPDGGRNARPDELLDFRLVGDAGPPFVLDDSGSGLGDAVVSVAKRVGDGFTIRGSAKLATGRERLLAGSGSTDWMLTVLRNRPVDLRRRSAGYYWGTGIVAPGPADRIPFHAEDWVAVGLVGGGIALGPRLGLKAQIEAHTRFYDAPFVEVGRTAAQLSVGGWWAFDGGGRLDIAVGEDLRVGTTPDVVLHATMRWDW